MTDLEVVLGLYLCGWLAVSLGLYLAGRRFTDRAAPASHPLLVSVAGGALWPVVLIGVVEMGSVMLYTRLSRPGPGILS
ncbi:Uncharacterised protein [Mycolicibacterium phlei]|jgi:hypothetical protein|uniref:Uncharacterized protein n=1 Tax=Mycolicibacterium phlei DSM 43239 = CCUG 21000 TaxID=1226750 RepID=A0A5N5VBI4_MYCPH|nr:hypothetical protein [Mycolicibacterium phlei]VEG07352.1 Uncharacterised protein [Mycobacteroides chelonae]AMO59220.1 hypothetical protein MPHLCCUG_00379 [Mycolicibacterium phlei]EID13816.1 hypothetical protein MPHLEI_13666 [Mycolicibacterium phlei RIVM601174]KAB7759106.1 hypothetical protein MPHL21000_04375 [Mycolicibacterium phlei DSM 43239 = CCUG 21000]KXW59739.1 hypothetical protein MPHL43072_11660 [Mycolicibacterium phlei DSM 43072]